MYYRLLLFVVTFSTLRASELQLQPETLKAWHDQVQKVTSAVQRGIPEVASDQMETLRSGDVVVWPVADRNMIRVPDGLIHDWIGVAFIPHAHIDDVQAVVRNYSRYRDIYKPALQEATLLSQSPGADRFSIVVRSGSFFTKTAIESENESKYTRVDNERSHSFTCTTRVQEIENYKRANEKKLPPDTGHGYIWRGCGFTQLEERDGGVYFTMEMLVLSRDVPGGLRWIAGPIIRRVARQTLTESIENTRAAVVKAIPTTLTTHAPATAKPRGSVTGSFR